MLKFASSTLVFSPFSLRIVAGSIEFSINVDSGYLRSDLKTSWQRSAKLKIIKSWAVFIPLMEKWHRQKWKAGQAGLATFHAEFIMELIWQGGDVDWAKKLWKATRISEHSMLQVEIQVTVSRELWCLRKLRRIVPHSCPFVSTLCASRWRCIRAQTAKSKRQDSHQNTMLSLKKTAYK